MRYYDLVISDAKNGEVYKPDPVKDGFVRSAGGSTFTSHTRDGRGNLVANPGALHVQFDLVSYPFHQSQGAAHIRIYGVGLGMISQSADLNPDPDQELFKTRVKLYAGMQQGLPLANPKQAGLILEGTVYQAFGNWEGTDQTLELIVNPLGVDPSNGFCFYWPAGSSLSSALASVLSQAMPGYTQKISVSPSLTLAHDEAGTYDNIFQFAAFLREMTQSDGAKIYGKKYPGVQISIVGNTVRAYDNTSAQDPVQLEFTDLVGQPTWMDPYTVNVKTVLRSDIAIGSYIKFPTQSLISPYALTAPGAAIPNTPARSKSAFQGFFWVNEVHHFASFRQPDASAWVTTINAVSVKPLTVS